MAASLYDLSVASYLQTLTGVTGFLDKGLAHLTSKNIDPATIVETRLYPDMLPFRFQVQAVVHQSLGVIEGIKRGVFAPPGDAPAHDYAGLQKHVADARETLAKLAPADVNAFEGEYERPIDPADRAALVAAYAPDVRELERLTGWDLSDWRR